MAELEPCLLTDDEIGDLTYKVFPNDETWFVSDCTDELRVLAESIIQANDAKRNRASGWQPIDTAPFGEWILVYEGARKRAHVVRKVIASGKVAWISQYIPDGELGHPTPVWLTLLESPPCHWMPLPKPPEGV